MDDLQSLIDSGRIGGAALKRVMDRRGLSDLTPAPREEQPSQPSAWWAQTGGEGDNDTRLDSESQQTQAMQNRLLGANPSTRELVQSALANPGQFAQLGGVMTPEVIRAPAVRMGDDIYEGTTHGMAADKGMDKYGDDIFEKGQSGFTTSTGRFVSAEEAKAIADRADQLKRPIQKPNLGTEDLRDDIQRGLGNLSPLQSKGQ